MARIKSDLRCCIYCSHRKVDIANLSYYCSNRQSEHYLEKKMRHLCIIAKAVMRN